MGSTTTSTACSPQNSRFYTAPSSPIPPSPASDHDNDGFEFEVTTEMFTSRCEFQRTSHLFWWAKRNDTGHEKHRLSGRARSFCSGQVLPLKPPPRLQTSVTSSPRSPNSMLRRPFSRPCAWNDDFDPFQFALEKVSNETRARMSFHRRSQSCSAYRTSSVAHWLDGSIDRDKNQRKHEFCPNNSGSKIFDEGYEHVGLRIMRNGHLKPRGPTLANMMEQRDSTHSRRVIPSEHVAKARAKSGPTVRAKGKGMWLGRKVKDGDHEHVKGCSEESKMHRVMSFLFKVKKGSNESERIRRWKLRRCLGYGPGSPPFMK